MTGLWGRDKRKHPCLMSSIGTPGCFVQSLAVRWSERPWPGAPGALTHLEFDLLVLLQGAEAGPRNFRVVDNTSASHLRDEPSPSPR